MTTKAKDKAQRPPGASRPVKLDPGTLRKIAEAKDKSRVELQPLKDAFTDASRITAEDLAIRIVSRE